MKTLIGKNLGQIRKSVNPIGCLKRASEKQCLSMRKPALVRRRTVCNRLKQDQIGTSCVTFGQK